MSTNTIMSIWEEEVTSFNDKIRNTLYSHFIVNVGWQNSADMEPIVEMVWLTPNSKQISRHIHYLSENRQLIRNMLERQFVELIQNSIKGAN